MEEGTANELRLTKTGEDKEELCPGGLPEVQIISMLVDSATALISEGGGTIFHAGMWPRRQWWQHLLWEGFTDGCE